jgi:hypothetical protein
VVFVLIIKNTRLFKILALWALLFTTKILHVELYEKGYFLMESPKLFGRFQLPQSPMRMENSWPCKSSNLQFR